MFGVFMTNGISSNVNRSLVVTVKKGKLKVRYSEVVKDETNPNKFTNSGAMAQY